MPLKTVVAASDVWQHILRLEAAAFDLRTQLQAATRFAPWYREECHDVFLKTMVEGDQLVTIECPQEGGEVYYDV